MQLLQLLGYWRPRTFLVLLYRSGGGSAHATLEGTQPGVCGSLQPMQPWSPLLEQKPRYLNILVICCCFQFCPPRVSLICQQPLFPPIPRYKNMRCPDVQLFTSHRTRGPAGGSLLIPSSFLEAVPAPDDYYKPHGHGQA